MKKAIGFLIVSSLFFSCKKEDLSAGQTASGSLVSSITLIGYNGQDHTVSIDSFVYDGNRITKILAEEHDYYPSISDTSISTMQWIFSYPSGSSVPASYSVLGTTSDNFTPSSVSNVEVHQLLYDNQNRIIKDTLTQGEYYLYGQPYIDSPSIVTYTYAPNTVTSSTYDNGGYYGVELLADIHSFIFNNGNVVNEKDSVPYASYATFTPHDYKPYANPLYSSYIANTIGPLLDNSFSAYSISHFSFFIFPGFMSRNIMDDITNSNYSQNVITDNNGRVIQLVSTSSYEEMVYNYYK